MLLIASISLDVFILWSSSFPLSPCLLLLGVSILSHSPSTTFLIALGFGNWGWSLQIFLSTPLRAQHTFAHQNQLLHLRAFYGIRRGLDFPWFRIFDSWSSKFDWYHQKKLPQLHLAAAHLVLIALFSILIWTYSSLDFHLCRDLQISLNFLDLDYSQSAKTHWLKLKQYPVRKALSILTFISFSCSFNLIVLICPFLVNLSFINDINSLSVNRYL